MKISQWGYFKRCAKRAWKLFKAYYDSKKSGVIDYDLTKDRGYNEVLELVFALEIVKTAKNAESDKKVVFKEALLGRERGVNRRKYA